MNPFKVRVGDEIIELNIGLCGFHRCSELGTHVVTNGKKNSSDCTRYCQEHARKIVRNLPNTYYVEVPR
jgi:hypothetical protein